jgi:parallel beta-helix repeat protein
MSSEGLRYDYRIQSNADPSEIMVEVENSVQIMIEDHLVFITSRNRPVREIWQDSVLRAYQADDREVAICFQESRKSSQRYSLQLGSYDVKQSLVIELIIHLAMNSSVHSSDNDLIPLKQPEPLAKSHLKSPNLLSGSGEDYPAPSNGDWVVDSETRMENEDLTLNGNLVIQSGGNLTLSNVILRMNCSYDGEYNITVEIGGHLTIKSNSTVTAVNSSHAWCLKARGATLNLFSSKFRYGGWNPPNNYFTDDNNGIYCTTDGAQIINNTIEFCFQGLKFYTVQDSIVANNTITNISSYGIVHYYGSNNTIRGNDIKNCNIGLYIASDYNKILQNDIKGSSSDAMRIAGSYCIASNNTIEDSSWDGIYVAGDNNVISNNTILRVYTKGIYLRYSRDSLVINNTIIESDYGGIRVSDSEGNISIIGNMIHNISDYGIFIYSCRNEIGYNISQNTIILTRGLSINANNSIVQNNTILDTDGIGIYSYVSANTNFTYNSITFSRIEGIRLNYAINSTIADNSIQNGADDGIAVYNSINSTFRGNRIIFNSLFGIYVESNTGSCKFWNNSFTANAGSNAYDANGTNLWDNTLHGNYWDDYTGPDNNNNGIGDIPYSISGGAGAEDRFPLIKDLLLSYPPIISIHHPINKTIAYRWVALAVYLGE